MARFTTRRLGARDVGAMRALLAVYAEAFEDDETYLGSPPSDGYLEERLADPGFITLVAEADGAVLGGLSAYVLAKFERERSEVYIYDLAVAEAHRRQGVATALIEALKPEARRAGAWVIYVQADYEDPPAIALYEGLGAREEVLHFDIDPGTDGGP